jgi:hypothetical protein
MRPSSELLDHWHRKRPVQALSLHSNVRGIKLKLTEAWGCFGVRDCGPSSLSVNALVLVNMFDYQQILGCRKV